jgi:hypothetical protein
MRESPQHHQLPSPLRRKHRFDPRLQLSTTTLANTSDPPSCLPPYTLHLHRLLGVNAAPRRAGRSSTTAVCRRFTCYHHPAHTTPRRSHLHIDARPDSYLHRPLTPSHAFPVRSYLATPDYTPSARQKVFDTLWTAADARATLGHTAD